MIRRKDEWTPIAPPSKGSTSVRTDPELLYARVPSDFMGHVLSFDGSAKTEQNGGYGSCSWILWRLPTWDVEIAASAHLSSTTVNIAEYTGMNHGVAAALDRGITNLIIVGDSRLAIQQSMGLQVELARHKALTKQLGSTRYLHVLRTYNAAADALATEALEAKAGRVILNADRKAELQVQNRIQEVLYVDRDSAKDDKVTPNIAAVTRSQARRVHFEDNGRRAKEHNEALSRVERRAIPTQDEHAAESPTIEEHSTESPTSGAPSAELPNTESPSAELTQALFKEGDQVWLLIEQVKTGLTKKLTHRWHGPFRIKKKVEEFAYELELPGKSVYRFYPVVHISRLKAVKENGERPTTRLRPEPSKVEQFDFDEELLPEDSWEPDEGEDRYEVEAILDDELPLSTSTAKTHRKLVQVADEN
ncbi:hypothetical protein PF003_g28876 [Phytophthora fragariae]|nr:hypothetical protein PF003_g28876 [Phytophthora fragariae]